MNVTQDNNSAPSKYNPMDTTMDNTSQSLNLPSTLELENKALRDYIEKMQNTQGQTMAAQQSAAVGDNPVFATNIKQPVVNPVVDSNVAPASVFTNDQTSTRQEQTSSGKNIKKEVAGYNKATGKVASATEDIANQESAINDARASGLAMMATREQQDLQEMQVKLGVKKTAEAKALQDITDKENELASYKIDPNKWYANAGNVIIGAIGLALGTYGSIVTKTENSSLQIINAAVNRDIEAQKLEYKRLGDKVDNSKNQYARLVMQGNSEQQAESLLRIANNTATGKLIDSVIARSSSQQIKDKGKLLATQVLQDGEKFKVEMAKDTAASKVTNLGQTLETKENLLTGKNAADSKDPTMTNYGAAYNLESAKMVKTAEETALNADSLNRDMQAYIQEFGMNPVTSGIGAGRAELLRTRIIGYLTTIANSGVLNSGEYERYRPLADFGNFSGVLSRWDKFGELVSGMAATSNAKLESAIATHIPGAKDIYNSKRESKFKTPN